MDRNNELRILNALVKNQNLVRHHLAAAVCMKAVAAYLKKKDKKKFADVDEAKWEMTGMFHDADYERTKDRPKEHGIIVIDEVRSQGFELPPDVSEAIKFHNKDNVSAQESLMGWGIWTTDELTGLIVACALILPDKKLASVNKDFVLKKMKEPSFAAGAIRERIYDCEPKLGIKLADFTDLCLKAMQSIAGEIGL